MKSKTTKHYIDDKAKKTHFPVNVKLCHNFAYELHGWSVLKPPGMLERVMIKLARAWKGDNNPCMIGSQETTPISNNGNAWVAQCRVLLFL